LDSVRTEYSLVSRGLEGKEVEARVMAGVVGDVVGQPLDIAWHRWREHIDDVLMPSHLLFNGATEPKEFLVPRGVGSRFIEKVVVSDGDYQKIEDKVHAEYKGRFAVGGRDWRDVVVKAEEYNNSQRIVEGRQLIGEFRERFGVK